MIKTVYTPIVGTLIYVVRDGKVLMIHRNARQGDDHIGKYNGLGGKMHSSENLYESALRELQEEAGIIAKSMKMVGTVNWTTFGKNGEDWLGFVFRVDAFEGEPIASNPEGSLEWVAIDQLHTKPLWESDWLFLQHVFDKEGTLFHAYIPCGAKSLEEASIHFE